jgi:hypothetical protein
MIQSQMSQMHPGGLREIRNCWFTLLYFERACHRAAKVFCYCFTALRPVMIMSVVDPTVDRVSDIVLGFLPHIPKYRHQLSTVFVNVIFPFRSDSRTTRSIYVQTALLVPLLQQRNPSPMTLSFDHPEIHEHCPVRHELFERRSDQQCDP